MMKIGNLNLNTESNNVVAHLYICKRVSKFPQIFFLIFFLVIERRREWNVYFSFRKGENSFALNKVKKC